jgi:2-keto-4-pentenoate hydratase/2-oxohepta-3-ene-1,7-dioic acid hydratase in catechol pathway
MKFAQVILDNATAIVMQRDNDEWRPIDFARDMFDVISSTPDELEAAYQRGKVIDTESVRFRAPISNPGKILAIGRNYMDHIRETNATVPAAPLIFAKLTSAINHPGGAIEWDPNLTAAVDFEAELAVVIGQTARNVDVETALDHVFGYTCANDVTARDLQNGDGQWTRGKGLDTFCPLGPWIVTADEIPDPQKLAVRCEVNGKQMQNGKTSDMIFDVKSLIAYASKAFTLHPGDIILTGTPDGVGFYRKPPINLHDGDTIVVEVEKIGRLESVCRETVSV